MSLKKQMPIKFENVCGCIVDEKALEAAVLWYSTKPVRSRKKITLHGKYAAVSIGKEKIHVHRLLVMYKEKRKLAREEYVHHKDENKLNNSLSNLEIVNERVHQSFHNKGRPFSEIHKMRLSEAGRRRVGIKLKRKVIVDLNQLSKMVATGETISSMARHFKCDRSTIRERIREHPHLLKEA